MFGVQNAFVNSKDTKSNKRCQFNFLSGSVVKVGLFLKKLVFLIIMSVMCHKKSKDKSQVCTRLDLEKGERNSLYLEYSGFPVNHVNFTLNCKF